jgi:3-methyladenine DNA glycosylase AlkD
MTYLIIRETEYIGIENSFHVVDQTTDIDIADDKLRDIYSLIQIRKKAILF